MKQGLTVFLCSTFADLAPERGAVLDAVRKLQLQHDSMEFFGARPGLPIETCLAEVRRSHVLVVIVGHRYGTIVPNLGVSFSEAEYEEGFRLTKPCLIYMLDENVPVLPRNVDRDPDNIRKLERWKSILRDRHTVATFTNSHGLAVQVAVDLGRTLETLEESEETLSSGSLEASDIDELLSEAGALGLSRERLLSALRQSMRSVAAKQNDPKPRVFFSYSHTDKPLVQKLAGRLRASGVEVWIDESEIKIGDSLIQKIEWGLDSADFVVFVVSSSSLQSEWARRELNVALTRAVSGEGGASLLPILAEDVELPPLLRTLKYLDLRDGNTERATRQLMEAIQQKWTRRKLAEAPAHGTGTGTFRVFLNIQVRGADAGKVVKQALLEIPEVVEVTETYGDVDIVAVIAVDEIGRVNTVVQAVSRISGVLSMHTLIGTSQHRGPAA